MWSAIASTRGVGRKKKKKNQPDFVEQWLLYLPMMWKRENGGVYVPKQRKKKEVVVFLSYLYQEFKLFHDKNSFALFSSLNFNGMVVQPTAAAS